MGRTSVRAYRGNSVACSDELVVVIIHQALPLAIELPDLGEKVILSLEQRG